MGNCSSNKSKNVPPTTLKSTTPTTTPEPQKELQAVKPPEKKIEPKNALLAIFFDGSEISKEEIQTDGIILNKLNNVTQVINERNFDYLHNISKSDISKFSFLLKELNSGSIVDIKNKLSTSLDTILPGIKSQNKVDFELYIKYDGLHISKDVKTSYAETTFIAKPIEDSDPFEIIIFNKSNETIEQYTFAPDQSPAELSNFSFYSAICNGANHLYVSGGEKCLSAEKGMNKKVYFNFFYDIDIVEKTIACLPNLIEERFWHSMIYIPLRYIFIVGGVCSSNAVEIYDIESKTISKDGSLLESRCEPSLCCLDNTYLYVFCGYERTKSNFLSTIERTNLREKTRLWEQVPYKLSGNQSLDSRFFSLIGISESKVLIIGGIDISKKYLGDQNVNEFSEKNYYFDSKTNIIESIEISGKNDRFYSEKFFCPISSTTHAIIPLSDIPKVILFQNGIFRTLFLGQSNPNDNDVNSSRDGNPRQNLNNSNIAKCNSLNDKLQLINYQSNPNESNREITLQKTNELNNDVLPK